LTERRQGNEKYRCGDYQGALYHYQRASAVVDFVKGLSRADQAEVNINRVAVYLNIAAAKLALGEYSAAVDKCTAALDLDPQNVKALVRRARAEMKRHEYGNAERDIEMLREMGGGYGGGEVQYEVEDLQKELLYAKKKGVKAEKAVFSDMFSR
jgi:tetratricopeptide (TPR) repeat protein